MFRYFAVGMVGLALAGGAVILRAQEKAITVEKIVTASSVENREPVGAASEFDASVGRVYCWTKIAAQAVPTEVRHVWSVEGQKVLEVPLAIKFPSTRTWSIKTVRPGNWRVEVVDAAGTVLASVDFTVKAVP